MSNSDLIKPVIYFSDQLNWYDEALYSAYKNDVIQYKLPG